MICRLKKELVSAAEAWLPLSDWQPSEEAAAAFLPIEATSGGGPLPEWVLYQRCHAFGKWSFRYCVSADRWL